MPAWEFPDKYRTLFDSIGEGFCVIEVPFDAQDEPVDDRFAAPVLAATSGRSRRFFHTFWDVVSASQPVSSPA